MDFKIDWNILYKTCLLSKLSYEEPPMLIEYLSKLFVNFRIIFYDNNNSDTQAYFIINENDNEVFLVFRGTNDIKDILYDLDIRPYKLNNIGTIHRGFYNQLIAVLDSIIKDLNYLDHENNKIKVNICGHSLGAALASLATIFIKKQFPLTEINCFTYGSPRVGNDIFVQNFNKYVNNYWRITNDDDPISMYPISSWYKHIPKSIIIDDNKNYKIVTDYYDGNRWIKRLLNLLSNFTKIKKEHSNISYLENISFIMNK